jgi:hypothetical protein
LHSLGHFRQENLLDCGVTGGALHNWCDRMADFFTYKFRVGWLAVEEGEMYLLQVEQTLHPVAGNLLSTPIAFEANIASLTGRPGPQSFVDSFQSLLFQMDIINVLDSTFHAMKIFGGAPCAPEHFTFAYSEGLRGWKLV